MLRASFTLGVFIALFRPAWADADLFACRIIVTGTEDRQHPDAWERCLRDVIVKATGRPSLAEDDRILPILKDAARFKEDFAYLDRMTDLPRHDEQGTRDRPYDLIVRFRAGALTERLQQAGLQVWRSRPGLEAVIFVQPREGGGFPVTAERDESERHRQALLAAADRFGMRLSVPAADALAPAGLGAVPPGKVRLLGALRWSEADFGWNAEWTIAGGGEPAPKWTLRGVSFDEAYRAGVGGAAERLSRR